MGTPSQAITAPPPPPPGFTLDAPASSVPPPPAGFTLDATPGTLPPRMTPENATSSIGPAPSTSSKILGHLGNIAASPVLGGNPLDDVAGILDSIRENLVSSEHPAAQAVGQKLDAAKELLIGGGPNLPKSGILNNPVTASIGIAPAAAETGEALTAKAGEAFDAYKATRAAKATEEAAQVAKAAQAAKTARVNPDQFVYREPTPAPQHGSPVKVASPLDNATINKLPGGKDLSPEAVETLKKHIGGKPGQEIEVGSTAKNTLHKAVEPVQKTIKETGVKMNEAVSKAAPFKQSIIEELTPNMPGTNPDLYSIAKLRENIPGGDEEKLNATIDKEMKSADEALRSKDPSEVLAYRRKLSTQIDWNDIAKNPSTPGETQNAARAKIYQALTDKIHREIPDTVPLDKVFQPNLELQSHLDAKLGKSVSRDAVEAHAQQLSEFNKGKAQIENESHNEVVAQNRKLAGMSESDVEPSIKAGTAKTPVDESIDQAVSKFKAPPEEQAALKTMLKPSVKAGRVFGTNISWVDALNSFDKMAPEARAARFSNPTTIRQTLQSEAKKQFGKAIIKYGSVAAVGHLLGIDRAILKAMLGD